MGTGKRRQGCHQNLQVGKRAQKKSRSCERLFERDELDYLRRRKISKEAAPRPARAMLDGSGTGVITKDPHVLAVPTVLNTVVEGAAPVPKFTKMIGELPAYKPFTEVAVN